MDTDKRGIVIMGATSGMGREVARLFALRGWRVGAAGRRVELLESLRDECPDGSVVISQIDVTAPEASARLEALAQKVSATVYLHCSGVGYRNEELDPEPELRTLRTNGEGFVRAVGTMFRYFAHSGGGRIAVISSIAGTKGLGPEHIHRRARPAGAQAPPPHPLHRHPPGLRGHGPHRRRRGLSHGHAAPHHRRPHRPRRRAGPQSEGDRPPLRPAGRPLEPHPAPAVGQDAHLRAARPAIPAQYDIAHLVSPAGCAQH